MPLQHTLRKRTEARVAQGLIDHGEGAGQNARRACSLRCLPTLEVRHGIGGHFFSLLVFVSKVACAMNASMTGRSSAFGAAANLMSIESGLCVAERAKA